MDRSKRYVSRSVQHGWFETAYRRLIPSDTLFRRLLNGSLWSLIGAAFSRGITLVAMIIVGRILGASAFGELGIVQSTIGVFGIFVGTGLGMTATKYVAEYRTCDTDASGEYLSLTMRIAVVGGMVTSGILFVFAPQLATDVFHAPLLTRELRISSGLVLFGAITGVQIGALAGLEDFRTLSIVSTIRALLVLSGTITGALMWNLMGAVIGLTLAEVFTSVVGQIFLKSSCHKAHISVRYDQIDRDKLGRLWRFTLPAVLTSLVIQPAMWASNVMLINQPNGYTGLGVFNAADKYRQLLLFLPASLSSIILSMLSNLRGSKNLSGYQKVFAANFWVNLCAILVPSLFLVYFASVAMAAFGEEFQNGSSTLVILAASAVFVVLNTVLGQVLISSGRIWLRFGLDVILGCTLVLCSWVWIPWHQGNGLAAANVAAYGLTCLLLIAPVAQALRKQELDSVRNNNSFPL